MNDSYVHALDNPDKWWTRGSYLTFLCTFNFLKISVASRRWALSTILRSVSQVLVLQLFLAWELLCSAWDGEVLEKTYFLTLKATSGRLSRSATQYPLMRKRKVKKP
jgi:hypothetical protein